MARKSQDLIILQGGVPSYMGNRTTRINLADFYDNFGLFSRNTYSDLVISGSNMVCNIDLGPVMRQHVETDADVTMVTKRIVSALDQSGDDVGIQGGEGNRVIGLSDNNNQGFDRVYLDMMIILDISVRLIPSRAITPPAWICSIRLSPAASSILSGGSAPR